MVCGFILRNMKKITFYLLLFLFSFGSFSAQTYSSLDEFTTDASANTCLSLHGTASPFFFDSFSSTNNPNVRYDIIVPTNLDPTTFSAAFTGSYAAVPFSNVFDVTTNGNIVSLTLNVKNGYTTDLAAYSFNYYMKVVNAFSNQLVSIKNYENNTEVQQITPSFFTLDINQTGCLVAQNDGTYTVSPGGTTPSVFANDTSSFGMTPNTTPDGLDTSVLLTNLGGLTGATINANGTINVPSTATPGATYVLTYQICSPEGTSTCTTAQATIKIPGGAPANCSSSQYLIFSGDTNSPAGAVKPHLQPAISNSTDVNGNPYFTATTLAAVSGTVEGRILVTSSNEITSIRSSGGASYETTVTVNSTSAKILLNEFKYGVVRNDGSTSNWRLDNNSGSFVKNNLTNLTIEIYKSDGTFVTFVNHSPSTSSELETFTLNSSNGLTPFTLQPGQTYKIRFKTSGSNFIYIDNPTFSGSMSVPLSATSITVPSATSTTTVTNLNSLISSSFVLPQGYTVKWIDGNGVDVSNNTTFGPGSYTAHLYSTANNCIQASTSTVTVVANPACYKTPASGTGLATNHGITALGRAGAETSNDNWPMVRTGAWTVLESKTKGFVLNRVANPQTAIANPVEGMMVYDTAANCLKVYFGATKGWSCLDEKTCGN